MKELWDYIESVYPRKDNLTHLYDLCQILFHMKAKGKTLSQIYIEFNCIYEEGNTSLCITNDIFEMSARRE